MVFFPNDLYDRLGTWKSGSIYANTHELSNPKLVLFEL